MATATAPHAPSIAAEAPSVEPEGLYEVVDGQIVEKSPMGAFEAWLASILFRALVTTPGVVDRGRVASEMLFRIDAERGLDRRPDLAFVSFDRWPSERPVPRVSAWEVVPDLAIEVVSPNDKTADDVLKLEQYFGAGVRLVWLVLPNVARLYAYDSPASVTILSLGETLDGAAVLPDFRLPLADLFGDAPA